MYISIYVYIYICIYLYIYIVRNCQVSTTGKRLVDLNQMLNLIFLNGISKILAKYIYQPN